MLFQLSVWWCVCLCCREAVGLSGRSLRKLPFLAHALYVRVCLQLIDHTHCSLTISTAHWTHLQLTDHTHSSLTTPTAHWPYPQLTDHIHSSLTTPTAHWPHPHLTDHIHSSLTIQTYIHTNLYSAKNHKNASEALTYFFHLSLSSVILTDSSTRSPVPVHVLMLFFILSESPAFTAVCCYRPH